MKVGIVIITYNIPPEVTILQIEALRKFCKDNFVIEIIDNSSLMDFSKDIKYHCERLGVNYKKTYAVALDGSDSHTFAANFSYQMLKNEYNYFCYLDHDLLPVQPFSIIEILGENKVIAGVGQSKNGVTYLWPGALIFKKMDEINFGVNNSLGLDTGGELRLIIDKYGKGACIFFNESYHQNVGFNGQNYNYYAMINDGMFMHFVNGSGWNKVDKNEDRINSLLNIAREKVESNVG